MFLECIRPRHEVIWLAKKCSINSHSTDCQRFESTSNHIDSTTNKCELRYEMCSTHVVVLHEVQQYQKNGLEVSLPHFFISVRPLSDVQQLY